MPIKVVPATLVNQSSLITNFTSLKINAFGIEQGDDSSLAVYRNSIYGGAEIVATKESYWYSTLNCVRAQNSSAIRFQVKGFASTSGSLLVTLQYSKAEPCSLTNYQSESVLLNDWKIRAEDDWEIGDLLLSRFKKANVSRIIAIRIDSFAPQVQTLFIQRISFESNLYFATKTARTATTTSSSSTSLPVVTFEASTTAMSFSNEGIANSDNKIVFIAIGSGVAFLVVIGAFAITFMSRRNRKKDLPPADIVVSTKMSASIAIPKGSNGTEMYIDQASNSSRIDEMRVMLQARSYNSSVEGTKTIASNTSSKLAN